MPISFHRHLQPIVLLTSFLALPHISAIAGPGVYIAEYRVEGSSKLGGGEIAEAVYPYLGPGRGEGDVEGARAALEKAFVERGYQTVAVEVPEQEVARGVVVLRVVEAPV
ncbi:MAG: POTRA domain-containing protein, partial [candidate division Zixibacteria bacterium]|nr:POTRA domain-containing protein [candidate division Zixibacteria bacterium]